MQHPYKSHKLPGELKIGERFLLSFHMADNDSNPQLGRLQDLSSDGALCIDVDPKCRPARGTPVTVSSTPQSRVDFCFSSEILGRRQAGDRLPLLLLKAPNTIQKQQRRTSFRISAALKAKVVWDGDETLSKPAVLTNLSGGGAQLFMRWLPQTERIQLSIGVPDAFIEEWAKRQVRRINGYNAKTFSIRFKAACDTLRASFEKLETRLREDDRGPIYALAASFVQPSEESYRLVRYLERQALQRGVQHPTKAPTLA